MTILSVIQSYKHLATITTQLALNQYNLLILFSAEVAPAVVE